MNSKSLQITGDKLITELVGKNRKKIILSSSGICLRPRERSLVTKQTAPSRIGLVDLGDPPESSAGQRLAIVWQAGCFGERTAPIYAP